MVPDSNRLCKTPKRIKTSYLFIDTFTLQTDENYLYKLAQQGMETTGNQLCYINDPIIYCTANKLRNSRHNFEEIISFYLLKLSSFPHIKIDWYQLDNPTEDKISFFAYLSNMVKYHSNKELVMSCGIIPTTAKNNDIGYLHYFVVGDTNIQKFAFIYQQDALKLMTEIIKKFNLSPKEISGIVKMQEEMANQPKYYKPSSSTAPHYVF